MASVLSGVLLAGCVEPSFDQDAYDELAAWAASATTLHDPVLDDLEAVLEDPDTPQLQAGRQLPAVERALAAREGLTDADEVRTWTIRNVGPDGEREVTGEEFAALIEELEASLFTLQRAAEDVRDAEDRTDPALEEAVAEADAQAQEARTRYRLLLFGGDDGGG